MKKIKLGLRIIGGGLIYWFIYNTYFGWNMTPESLYEVRFDNIFKVIITVGWVIYFLPLLDIYESFIKKHESKS